MPCSHKPQIQLARTTEIHPAGPRPKKRMRRMIRIHPRLRTDKRRVPLDLILVARVVLVLRVVDVHDILDVFIAGAVHIRRRRVRKRGPPARVVGHVPDGAVDGGAGGDGGGDVAEGGVFKQQGAGGPVAGEDGVHEVSGVFAELGRAAQCKRGVEAAAVVPFFAVRVGVVGVAFEVAVGAFVGTAVRGPAGEGEGGVGGRLLGVDAGDDVGEVAV